jgi:glutathione S-transferase
LKLFAHSGASSLSVHILLRETELPFELEVVNAIEKVRAFGGDYRQINPRGMVPALELEDGTILTENLVIAQYLCDTAGRADLMPAAGTKERYKVMEWQSFIATELHKRPHRYSGHSTRGPNLSWGNAYPASIGSSKMHSRAGRS